MLEIEVSIFPRILEILEISVFPISTILEILEIEVSIIPSILEMLEISLFLYLWASWNTGNPIFIMSCFVAHIFQWTWKYYPNPKPTSNPKPNPYPFLDPGRVNPGNAAGPGP